MKQTLRRRTGSAVALTVSIGCAVLLLAVDASHATNAPVAVPYSDSFEGYTNNAWLIGTNGWYSGNPTGAVVIAGTYDFPLRTPLGVSSNSRIVQIVEDVTNVLTHATGADTNVWVDLMLLPVRSAVPPLVSNDVQLAVYVNTNGQLRVRHKYYRTGATPSLVWTTLTHPPLPSNEWARITIKLDYLSGEMYYVVPGAVEYTNKFFQISINGSQPITNELAYTTIPFALIDGVVPYPTGGDWFMMANSGAGGGETKISSVTIQGTGHIDDYVVTNGDVFADLPTRWLIEATAGTNGTIYPGGNLLIPEGDSVDFTMIPNDGYVVSSLLVDGSPKGVKYAWSFTNVTAAHTIHANFTTNDYPVSDLGVLLSWYAAHGIDPDGAGPQDGEEGDWDGDGALNWEEYVADTIPTDSNSVFTVFDANIGSFEVTWLAGATNGGSTASFSVLRTTNIMDTNTWVAVTNGLPRDPSGTNVWIDTNPPTETPVFYRPAIPWAP